MYPYKYQTYTLCLAGPHLLFWSVLQLLLCSALLNPQSHTELINKAYPIHGHRLGSPCCCFMGFAGCRGVFCRILVFCVLVLMVWVLQVCILQIWVLQGLVLQPRLVIAKVSLSQWWDCISLSHFF